MSSDKQQSMLRLKRYRLFTRANRFLHLLFLLIFLKLFTKHSRLLIAIKYLNCPQKTLLSISLFLQPLRTQRIQVFRLQTKALRNVAGASRFAGCQLFIFKHDILTLTCIYIYKVVLFVEKKTIFYLCVIASTIPTIPEAVIVSL